MPDTEAIINFAGFEMIFVCKKDCKIYIGKNEYAPKRRHEYCKKGYPGSGNGFFAMFFFSLCSFSFINKNPREPGIFDAYSTIGNNGSPTVTEFPAGRAKGLKSAAKQLPWMPSDCSILVAVAGAKGYKANPIRRSISSVV